MSARMASATAEAFGSVEVRSNEESFLSRVALSIVIMPAAEPAAESPGPAIAFVGGGGETADGAANLAHSLT